MSTSDKVLKQTQKQCPEDLSNRIFGQTFVVPRRWILMTLLMRFTSVTWNKLPQQPLNGSSWNLVHIFIFLFKTKCQSRLTSSGRAHLVLADFVNRRRQASKLRVKDCTNVTFEALIVNKHEEIWLPGINRCLVVGCNHLASPSPP